jgi:hypothetical protein
MRMVGKRVDNYLRRNLLRRLDLLKVVYYLTIVNGFNLGLKLLFEFTLVCLLHSPTDFNFKHNNDLPLIIAFRSKEGNIFWQSIFRRFNLHFAGFQKVKDEDALSCFSAYFIMDGYRVGRNYWIIPKGTYVWIATRLYVFFTEKVQIIPKITGTGAEDWWSFKEDVYRETIINFFVFYQSFDMFAYNFAEINQSSYNL